MLAECKRNEVSANSRGGGETWPDPGSSQRSGGTRGSVEAGRHADPL